MKKDMRVTRNEEFTRIIQKRKFVKTTSFIVYFQPRRQEHARMGISVGKKLGNAVVRNKIKRQIRAMIDEVFDFGEDCDYIIIARPSFLKRSWQEARSELEYAKRKIQMQQKQKGLPKATINKKGEEENERSTAQKV